MLGSIKTLTTLFTTLLMLAACRTTGPEQLPDGERISEPIEARPVVQLAVTDSAPAGYLDQTLLFDATVTAVCQSAGCWMKVEDDGHSATAR